MQVRSEIIAISPLRSIPGTCSYISKGKNKILMGEEDFVPAHHKTLNWGSVRDFVRMSVPIHLVPCSQKTFHCFFNNLENDTL
jgi:hypothetical protein